MARRCADLCQFVDESLYLPGADLWLDASRPRPRAFVSHAHTDHLGLSPDGGSHALVLCTPETGRLIAALMPYGAPVPPIEALPLHHTIQCGGVRLTALPSGHILGGAMLLVESHRGRLLFAGDVRLSGSVTCPPAETVEADHLIIEDTFGALHASFAPASDGARRVLEFCRDAQDRGQTPVLVTTSNCGKAQDMVAALSAAGLRVGLQPKLFRCTEAYRELGVPLTGYAKVRLSDRGGGVRCDEVDCILVTCGFLDYNPDLDHHVDNPSMALVSGWAADDEAHHFDAAIPWSDHASREDLHEFVRRVNPSLVWTFAGEGALARELRAMGVKARHLGSL
ncbi:MAG TPA: hypothetical protein PLD23_19765 [Armatimonadota bacterium]|nr:hypothetical protein [Armatimonadota bacterium]HQK95745.1 hypothetical protein [Armatimonadota bacterium]